MIARNYFYKFYSMPITKEGEDATIKLTIDVTFEFLASVENIDMNVENWDLLIIYTIVQKLDQELKRLLETSQGVSPDIPKL
ncbi:unnamed protein product [Hermetia illucens]|uniref:Uncharacterized protein n=1 Tax=Hermetia illucens TaxID=343691 RepID=A0A7R8UDH1_HERIL|nr:unnamed protein product [Hermetia illucens]